MADLFILDYNRYNLTVKLLLTFLLTDIFGNVYN